MWLYRGHFQFHAQSCLVDRLGNSLIWLGVVNHADYHFKFRIRVEVQKWQFSFSSPCICHLLNLEWRIYCEHKSNLIVTPLFLGVHSSLQVFPIIWNLVNYVIEWHHQKDHAHFKPWLFMIVFNYQFSWTLRCASLCMAAWSMKLVLLIAGLSKNRYCKKWIGQYCGPADWHSLASSPHRDHSNFVAHTGVDWSVHIH